MTRLLPALAALAIVGGSGLVHGRWSDRTRDARALTEAVARLDRVPLELGDWSGSEVPIDRRGLNRMGVSGVIARRYEDRRRGEAVTAMIVCGPPGPVSAHGPEACYAGIGYEPATTPARVAARAGDDFWMSVFRKAGPAPSPDLRIFWAWGAHGRWRAADGPRLAFAGEPALYKLYILRESAPGDGRTRDDPCLEFARALLPGLQTALFPGP